jgi:hypothetical protein
MPLSVTALRSAAARVSTLGAHPQILVARAHAALGAVAGLVIESTHSTNGFGTLRQTPAVKVVVAKCCHDASFA